MPPLEIMHQYEAGFNYLHQIPIGKTTPKSNLAFETKSVGYLYTHPLTGLEKDSHARYKIYITLYFYSYIYFNNLNRHRNCFI